MDHWVEWANISKTFDESRRPPPHVEITYVISLFESYSLQNILLSMFKYSCFP